jgi:tetratricopeptide (TPR) repeat protein
MIKYAVRALSRRRTILVFDGVEVLDDVLPLRDLGGKHVVLLLSRRLSDAPDLAHRRVLDLLSAEQGMTLVQQLAGPRAADRSAVEQLVKHIGGYPLALQLIGSYLSSREEEVADYLKWFEEEGLLVLHHGEHRTQSVRVLLQRTYDSLTQSEQHLFMLLGLLAPTPFPLELVQGILELGEREVRQVLGSLINLSVLRRPPKQDYVISHPLVHTFVLECLSSQVSASSSSFSEAIALWRERCLTTLMTHFDQSDRYDASALKHWLPHVLPWLVSDNLTDDQYLRAARLFDAAGLATFTQGKYAEAEPLYQRALHIRGQQLGAEHPDVAFSLNGLANLYREQGKYVEAEPLYQRALRIREQQLGPEYPRVATALNNLALLYSDQGKYAEAEPLYERALKIREQQLGAEHPDVAFSLNGLANLYREQGKYVEAEPLYQRALRIREQQLGPEHSDVAFPLNGLANLYADQGRSSEARPLYKRALAICERIVGTNHPTTQKIRANYTSFLRTVKQDEATE